MSGIELVSVQPITTLTFWLITHLPSALGPTQPHVYSGFISWRVKHLVMRFRMRGVIPLFPHTPSWRGKEQLYLPFTTDLLLSKKFQNFV